MSVLVINRNRELQIDNDSFRLIRVLSRHNGKDIETNGFLLKSKQSEIVVDEQAKNKLLQPNKRYALMGHCQKLRPCGVFRLPNDLPLKETEKYILATVKISVLYPRNTYYLHQKDLEKVGLLRVMLENTGEKEIELFVGETALQLCLNKNVEVKFDINNKENRNQTEKLIEELAYLDCDQLQEFIRELAAETIRQVRENNAQEVTEFFQQHLDSISWHYLSANPNISVEFFQQHLDKIDWYSLSANPNISVEFFQQHLDKVNWLILSANPGIPVSFFKNHLDKVDWDWLSANSTVPLSFFQQHLDRVNWGFLSANPNIPVEFFEQHLDNIDWEMISFNSNIPIKFFQQHLDKVDWYNLSGNPNIPVDFFQQRLDEINWHTLSARLNIPIDFFQNHLDEVIWYNLSQNPSIPIDFFQEHLDRVNWETLSTNPSIPLSFFQKYSRLVNWETLSTNSSIPLSFFKKHLDKVSWELLSTNKFLYNKYTMINVIKKLKFFPNISVWKKFAINLLHKEWDY